MGKYTLEKKLQYDEDFDYYKGSWKFGRQQVPLTVVPPSISEYFMHAEDCLRSLGKDWKEVWERIIERCEEELRNCGRISAGEKVLEKSIEVTEFEVFMAHDTEMCFSINLDVKGILVEDELVEIYGDFRGTLTSSELVCLA